MPQVIETQNLCRFFGDVEAVKNVNLAVDDGEIFGFLGPNGAGKSTLVKVLTTLITPTAGSAQIFGLDVAEQANEIRLKIGVALQEASLDDKQTGRENLTVQGELYGLNRKEIARRIEELSSIIEMSAIDRMVGEYSGGMKRRLDLAASLMHNPQMLFLDEPTTGLDPTSRAQVWQEVTALNKQLGTTIFLTTQYLEEADELADRVGIISNGSIVADGAPEALKRNVGSDVVQIRLAGDRQPAIDALTNESCVENIEVGPQGLLVSVNDGAAAVSPIAVALDAANVTVSELTLRTPTLDDVFLELTGDRIEVEA